MEEAIRHEAIPDARTRCTAACHDRLADALGARIEAAAVLFVG